MSYLLQGFIFLAFEIQYLVKLLNNELLKLEVDKTIAEIVCVLLMRPQGPQFISSI